MAIWSPEDTAAYKEAEAAGVDGVHFSVLRNEFRDLKPIKSSSGDTLQTVNEQARRKLFADKRLTLEQKTLIDKGLLRQADEKDEDGNVLSYRTADYSNEAMFELSLMDKETYAEAKEAVAIGVTPEKYLGYVNMYNNFRNSGGKAGNELLKRQLVADKELNPTQRQLVYDNVTSRWQMTRIDGGSTYNFGSEAAMEASLAGGKVYEKASNAVMQIGLSFDDYLKFHYATKDIESDKDKNGKTISNSKKKKIIQAIKGLGFNERQTLYLIREYYPTYKE